MKVLSVNKFHYLKGGSETCYFSLNELYREHGVDVVPFAMHDGRNEPSEYEKYFVDTVEYGSRTVGFRTKAREAAKIIYSGEARRKIRSIMEATRPDIAHLHVFQHQLSPSIIGAIKKFGIPAVNTVHDLKPLCPSYTMYSRGGICEKCRKHKYFRCASSKCFKDSAAASIVATVEMYLHHLIGSYRKIDAYITPSRFFTQKFIEYGFPAEKLHHIPNSIDCDLYRPDVAPFDYFIYFGRLSAEKGLFTLLEAMRTVKSSTLLIAGDGPIKQEIADRIRAYRLNNVKLLGRISGRVLTDLIEGCKFAVLPSEWYENCPMSVLESMACGKAVIGSNIGGIPELVTEGETGLLFEPGNAEQLADNIRMLLADPARTLEMGKTARHIAETDYDPRKNFIKMTGLYNSLFEKYGRPLWTV